MKLFQGLDRTDYQDVLRAIGLFLDERKLNNVRLIEHDDGIIVQGTPHQAGQTSHVYETLLLTDEDIQQIMRRSYGRRGNTGPLGQAPPTDMPQGRSLRGH